MEKQSSTTLNLTYSLVISLVVYYVIFIYKNFKILKFSLKIKGPFWTIIPWIGMSSVYFVIRNIKGQKVSPISVMQWLKAFFDFPVGGWFGSHYVYFSNDRLEIQTILNHPRCYGKGPFYKVFESLFKDSLLLVPYEIWKPRRKYYLKSFRPNVLKTFVPTFYQQSSQLLEEINHMQTGQDLYSFFNKYTFANFFYTSTGITENEVFNKVQTFEEKINEWQNKLIPIMIDAFIPLSIWFKLSPTGKELEKLIEATECMTENIIKAKRMQVDVPAYTEKNVEDFSLMDLMMAKTDDEIFYDIILFAAAATDTSGHALAFIFTLLGMNSDIQERLYDEIITVVGQNTISYYDLSNLKYTEAVINEGLRLFPPVPVITRQINADINIGTKIFPEGIEFIVDIFHLHRNPKYWEDPLKFDPTRFLPENASKIQPYTYLPFSGGRRDCIGKEQGMMLLKITVANVIRKFKITSKYKSVDEIALMSCITMKSTHPLDCHFLSRK